MFGHISVSFLCYNDYFNTIQNKNNLSINDNDLIIIIIIIIIMLFIVDEHLAIKLIHRHTTQIWKQIL